MRHITRKSSDGSKSGGSNMSSSDSSANSCSLMGNLRLNLDEDEEAEKEKVFCPSMLRSLSVDAVTLDRLDIIKTIGE